MNLLNLKPDELKNMSKQEIHEGYKRIISHMLMDFYIDCSNSGLNIETLEDLNNYINHWISTHIKSPNAEWNPGDCGK